MIKRRSRTSTVVIALGATQTFGWACSYYLPAIIADDIASALGLSKGWVFANFSAALLIAAGLGPIVGRIIDRWGGWCPLTISNVLFAAGLIALASSNGRITLAVAWTLIGIGMGCGLYDAAFATLAASYGREARAPITGITLMAGFASTIGFPLSAYLDAKDGWRGTCLVWAAIQVLVALPLNAFFVPRTNNPHRQQSTSSFTPSTSNKEMLLLAYVFSATWFVTGSMAAHLPRLLEGFGATTAQAIAAATVVGPAQVAARFGEFMIMRYVHPLVSARIAASMHPIGAGGLLLFGAPATVIFCLLHGAGTGLLTIAQGTLPLTFFGSLGYGVRVGLLGVPSRIAHAFAPVLFGILMDRIGNQAILVSASLYLTGLVALSLLKVPKKSAY